MIRSTRAHIALPLTCLLLSAAAAHAASSATSTDVTWVGNGTDHDYWSNAANWSPATVPNNNGLTTYNVTIPNTGDGLFTGPFLTLDPNTDSSITVSNLTLVNRGSIDPPPNSNHSNLTVTGTTAEITTPGHDGEYGLIHTKSYDTWDLGTLANIDSNGTLTGGYIVDFGSTMIASNADVHTNAGFLAIAGQGAQFVDRSGRNALRNLSVNGLNGSGQLQLEDQTFNTGGDFVNNGMLEVDAFFANSEFHVSGNFGNYDAASHSLNGGPITLHAEPGFTSVLSFSGGPVHSLNTNVRLEGDSRIVNTATNSDALGSLDENNSQLTLGGDRTITPSTGTFTNNGNLQFLNGSFVHVHGALTSTGVTVLATEGSSAQLQANGVISFEATSFLNGTGTVYTDLLMNAGTIAPGFSPGAITINANTTLTGTSNLDMQLGGTVQGTDYDVIHIGPGFHLALDGTLTVDLINGFVPSPSDTFDLVTSDQLLSGDFANLEPGHRVSTSDGSGSFLVTDNGTDVLLSNFAAATPEPGSLAMLAGGAMLLMRRRRS